MLAVGEEVIKAMVMVITIMAVIEMPMLLRIRMVIMSIKVITII